MSNPTTFDSPPTVSPREGIDDCIRECLERTMIAFEKSGLADEKERALVRRRFEENTGDEPDVPRDLIELLAKTQGTEEERMGIEVARISHAVAAVLPSPVQLIPFAGKLMAPSAFYESYTQLHELSKALLSPVIFAEDTDAIGTGALNPVAAQIMGEEILSAVSRRFGIRPFVTAIRLDYESWTFLSRKHFGL